MIEDQEGYIQTYFTYTGKKYIGHTRIEYVPFGVSGRARAEIFYSLVDTPVFIQDKTVEEYLEYLVEGKNCYCHDGKILMQVNTTIL
jgi:hypothetical protein